MPAPQRPGRDTISSLGKPARRATTQLDAIRAERPPARSGVGGWIKGALIDNAGLKLLSLILALTVYLLVNADEPRDLPGQRVAVRYLLPQDKALVSARVDSVEVTVRGSYRRIKQFDVRELGVIELDLTNAPDGEILIADRIRAPRGIEVVEVEPRSIRVAFEDKITDAVEVQATVAGRPLHGYAIARDKIRLDPGKVEVSGAISVMRALSAVRTQELRVDGASEDVEATLGLVPPTGVELARPDEQVTVVVPIEPAVVVKKLSAVPVEVRGAADPARWTVEPAQVDLEISGYQLDVEASIGAGVVAFVTVPSDLTKRTEVEVTVAGLRVGIGVKVAPAKVSVSPKK